MTDRKCGNGCRDCEDCEPQIAKSNFDHTAGKFVPLRPPKGASAPEPAPAPGQDKVFPSLIVWLYDRLNHRGLYEAPAILAGERDAFGRAKYKTPLMTGNSRNMIEDARQECGDLMMYIHGAKMEGRDLSELRPLIKVLQLMVENEPGA